MQSSTLHNQLARQKLLQRSRIQLQPIIKAQLLIQGSGGTDPPNNKQNEPTREMSLHVAYRKKQHALVSMENVAFKKRIQKRNFLKKEEPMEPDFTNVVLKGSNQKSSDRYSQSTHEHRQISNKASIRSPLTLANLSSNLIFNKSHKIQGILYNISSQYADRNNLIINLKEDGSQNKYSLKLPANKAIMILRRYFLDDVDLLIQALAVDRQHKRCFIKLDRVNRRSKSQLPLINEMDEELEESLRQTHSSLTKEDETVEQLDSKKRFKTTDSETPLLSSNSQRNV